MPCHSFIHNGDWTRVDKIGHTTSIRNELAVQSNKVSGPRSRRPLLKLWTVDCRASSLSQLASQSECFHWSPELSSLTTQTHISLPRAKRNPILHPLSFTSSAREVQLRESLVWNNALTKRPFLVKYNPIYVLTPTRLGLQPHFPFSLPRHRIPASLDLQPHTHSLFTHYRSFSKE